MQHLSKQISLHLVHRRRLRLRSGHERQQPLEIFPQLGYHLGGVESHGVSPEKNVLFKPIIPDCRLSFNSFFSLVMLPTDFSHTLLIYAPTPYSTVVTQAAAQTASTESLKTVKVRTGDLVVTASGAG